MKAGERRARALARATDSTGVLSINDVVKQMGKPGLGFERVDHLPGTTYKDSSTVIIIPTRGMIHHRVVSAWQALIAPMNQKRALLFASGHEVGQAYNAMVAMVLAHPELSKWRYIMTLEDDNLPPPDAHIRLLESIEWGSYDAISGLYFTKGDVNMPMAYGDPDEYARTGQLGFAPRDVKAALAAGQIMKVNGIAMGCALWKMDLFRTIPAPWYVTLNDLVPGKGIVGMTQDLELCSKAVRLGKRFAVDLRVKVGHLDINSGVVF